MDAASAIESILFVHGEPLTEKRIAAILEVPKTEVAAGLAGLSRRLAGRGLALIEHAGAWQLVTHPDCARFVEALGRHQHAEELSRAALETLAIVAYRGPLTRVEVEYIRGVQSSFSLRTLLLRGLVERAEHQDGARSFVYSVSMDFLKYLGLARLSDLPDYESLRRSVETEPSPPGISAEKVSEPNE